MEALQGSGPQLTIFYSGSVNVFDHVPAHKAQAVMLLLSDDHSSSNRSVLDCTTSDSLMPISKTGAVDQGAKASYPPPYCPSQNQPPAQPSTPATKDMQITQFITKQALSISKRSQAELPFARKASLARFLEKRKERVLDAMKRNEDVSVSAGGDDVKAFGSPCKRMKL